MKLTRILSKPDGVTVKGKNSIVLQLKDNDDTAESSVDVSNLPVLHNFKMGRKSV